MTIIDQVSVITIVDPDDLQIINNFVDRVKRDDIQVTKSRWTPGIEHQITIGKKKYHIRLYYNKLKTMIEKISFKVYKVMP